MEKAFWIIYACIRRFAYFMSDSRSQLLPLYVRVFVSLWLTNLCMLGCLSIQLSLCLSACLSVRAEATQGARVVGSPHKLSATTCGL